MGFGDIVDAVGGVDIYVPAPARDAFSGLEIGAPGCIDARRRRRRLAWVRSRHYEYLSSGSGQRPTRRPRPHPAPAGLHPAHDEEGGVVGPEQPVRLNRLIGIGVKNVTIDEGMSTKDITKLARRFNSLDAEKVETLTVPGEVTMINGASVIRLNKEESKGIIDRMNGIAPPPPVTEAPKETPPTTIVPPGDVDVRVLNGNGTPGAAAKTAAELKAFGYSITDTGDAGSDVARTTIRHPSGNDKGARQLQEALEAGAKLESDRSLTGDATVLVLGKDYTGFKEGVAPPAPTSTLLPSPVPSGRATPHMLTP